MPPGFVGAKVEPDVLIGLFLGALAGQPDGDIGLHL
jgi:hypothetical protein